jgi:hypothetical protein
MEEFARELIQRAVAEARNPEGSLLWAGHLLTEEDALRLEAVLTAAVPDEVSRVAAGGHPVENWSEAMRRAVVDGAIQISLADWNARRAEILRVFVDPAIIAACNRQGYFMMAACADSISKGTFAAPGCCSPSSQAALRKMRRDILSALDRPPRLSDTARHETAAILAWIAVRDSRRISNCGCG